MPKAKRYYSETDTEVGVTPSRLKRLGKARQLEYMTYWFHSNFQDPAYETPYESAEGGYQYVWGGPYEANDELGNEFGGVVSDARIEEAVEIVEGDGILEWAPGRDHPDTREREEEWKAERPEEDVERIPPEINFDYIIGSLQRGIVPKYADEVENNLRQKLLGEIEQLKTALHSQVPHAGIGHNNPPPDENSPSDLPVSDVQEAVETIEKELKEADPDALQVAKAASRLKTVLDWAGKKADVWAESFAKASGTSAGKWASRVVGAKAIDLLFPGIGILLGNVISSAAQWLHHVTFPFPPF